MSLPATNPHTGPRSEGSSECPRPEHPRPHLFRPDKAGIPQWLNLNGLWQFETDSGDSGRECGLVDRELEHTILLPFAPESEASGIGNTDFLTAVWYRREVRIPPEWQGRVILHCGAVDHDATLWVNGQQAGTHSGGFTPFSVDITNFLTSNTEQRHATLVLRARDSRDAPQARGKQSTWYANSGCHYTRTTGIWQTVWLECLPETHLRSVKITPQLGSGSFLITTTLNRNVPGAALRLQLSDDAGPITEVTVRADVDLAPSAQLHIPEARRRPWSPEDPHLYQLHAALDTGDGNPDTLESYAGLRSLAIDGQRLLLNGKPVFQRLVLDQGYWPESLMTAPSDAALIQDIQLAMEAGFNGARLHQKVFEERFLYHADRLGT